MLKQHLIMIVLQLITVTGVNNILQNVKTSYKLEQISNNVIK